ncbi:MAG TPA: alcohol dehydrogenase [Verrucomicrobia bacterium]|nr:alcohol dehydrogenase [Verrucomicrobiota bacterium]
MKWWYCLLLCSHLLVLPIDIHGDDWLHRRGPSSNGISSESEWLAEWPISGPTIVWNTTVGVGFSGIVISGGRLFTKGNEADRDTVYCLDINKGEILWGYSYDEPLDDILFEGGPTATPTVSGNSVYTISRQGKVFCFDVNDGTIQWSVNVAEQYQMRIPGWGFSGSVLVLGNRVILNVGDAGMALDRSDGSMIWKSSNLEAGYSSPVAFQQGGRTQILLGSKRSYVAVDALTGRERWRHRWLTRYGLNAADPVKHGPQVLLTSGYNKGAALLKLTDAVPEVIWKNKSLRCQMNSPVLLDGFVYGIDGNVGEGSLRCIEWNSGEIQWTEKSIGSGSLAATGDKLIVLSESGELIIAKASPEKFSPIAKAQVLTGKCWTAPTLSNSRIYARSALGELVCIQVESNSDQN